MHMLIINQVCCKVIYLSKIQRYWKQSRSYVFIIMKLWCDLLQVRKFIAKFQHIQNIHDPVF